MPNFRSTLLRRTGWLALVAMLAFAMLPSVSRWLATTDEGRLVEVCTPQGPRLVVAIDATGDVTGPTSGGAGTVDPCPFCAPAGAGIPLASSSYATPCDRTANAPPRRFLQASATRVAWLGAQSRAPPILS